MPIRIFDISDFSFRKILSSPQFALPIRWDGRNFESSLAHLFVEYIRAISSQLQKNDDWERTADYEFFLSVSGVCEMILDCVRTYHRGYPSKAFACFQSVMDKLVETPLNVYGEDGWRKPFFDDTLNLFRLRKTGDTAKHDRKEMFHVPASLRSLVSTCRYSIAGHPSLYLTTSIELGIDELGETENALISGYRLDCHSKDITEFGVIDLGLKPQDFLEENSEINAGIPPKLYRNLDLQARYLLWYPLIAACSFIRAYKSRPFAPEYIIPQLLMQWLRGHSDNNALMGIRYFSCASMRASNLGFNYVFPTYDTAYQDEYCSVLQSNFRLTEPVYYKDFSSSQECESFLIKHCEVEKI